MLRSQVGTFLIAAGTLCACRSADAPAEATGARRAPAAAALPASATRSYLLVGFAAPLELAEHRRLAELDLRLLVYLGELRYVLSAPPEVDVEDLLPPSASRVEAFTPRVDPAIRRELAAADPGELRRFRAQFHADVEPAAAASELRRLGVQAQPAGVGPSFRVWLDAAALARLLRSPLLASVDPPVPDPAPLCDEARAAVQADAVQSIVVLGPGAPPKYDGLSGAGIKIGIGDLGIDEDHPALLDPTTGGTRVSPAQPENAHAHGTFVASVAAGNGAGTPAPPGPYQWRGLAPEAGLAEYGPFADDAKQFHDALGADGVHLTTHTTQQLVAPKYTPVQAGFDAIVLGGLVGGYELPSAPAVCSAGNNGIEPKAGVHAGWYSITVTAKNALCVGSIDTFDGALSEFSSLGPTLDGRLKPDLVAPGTHRTRADVDEGLVAALAGTGVYGEDHGTSYSAPVVGGVVALMMQAVVEQLAGTAHSLRASTYKAILVQTALDRARVSLDGSLQPNPDTGEPTTYPVGPDFATGFGLVHAPGAVALTTSPSRWAEGALAATGEEHRWCVDVREGDERLRVALAWDDLPGSNLAGETVPKLVDDLDLWLVDPKGKTHRPYAPQPLDRASDLESGEPDPITTAEVIAAPRDVDRLNNVELAEVDWPMAGRWKVHVAAHLLALGTDQPYSVASSHPLRPLCFDLSLPEIDICRYLPWICEVLPEPPPLGPKGLRAWEGAQVLPLEDVLEHGAPRHFGVRPGWETPPPVRVSLEGVPDGAQAFLFDDDGRVQARGVASAEGCALLARPASASVRLHLALADREGAPLRGVHPVKVRIDRYP